MDSTEVENTNLKSSLEDWSDLEKEFIELEKEHEDYKKKLQEVNVLQKRCINAIAHHRYRIKRIQENAKKMGDTSELSTSDQSALTEMQKTIKDRKNTFREMEETLPHKNGLYLSIILGQVSVSLLDKEDKYAYKHEYEKFKVTVSYITLGLSILLLFSTGHRWLDAVQHFLLVWYYCTLTIRENILVVNGSRIKGWWVTHHFISTVCAAISLIWPDGATYQSFRRQQLFFSLYLSCVYIMQFFYQRGCLYRLKALGKSHEMDITVEGFMSWMWKGLTFLLPFLFGGYFFQLYNSYILYKLSQSPECKEWQVWALALIHFILFTGNTITTLKVIQQKLRARASSLKLKFLQNKYKFNSHPKNI